jgi:hypothetical protein
MAFYVTIVFFDLSRAIISQLVTGYLPSVILQFVSSCVPKLMKKFSAMQGFASVSGIERSACNKMLRFTIWTVFFSNILTGTAYRQLDIFLDPKEIPSKLAILVPAQVGHLFCCSLHHGKFSKSFGVYYKKVTTGCFRKRVSFSKLHITRIVNLSVGMRAILMQLY